MTFVMAEDMMGMIVEIKTFLQEHLPVHDYFRLPAKQCTEYSSVMLQREHDLPGLQTIFQFARIMIFIPAFVIAEALVHTPSGDGFIAGEAGLCFSGHRFIFWMEELCVHG